MSRLNARQIAVFTAIAAFAVTGAILATRAESQPTDRTAVIAGTDTTEVKIGRAMSAGPPEIARSRRLSTKTRKGAPSSYGRVQRLYLHAGESERDRPAGDVR